MSRLGVWLHPARNPYAALFADLQLNAPNHARDFANTSATALDGRHLAPVETSAATAPKRPRTSAPLISEPPARLRELSSRPSANDSVVVPASLWPAYTCRELGGAGWKATVTRVHRTAALVSFDNARARDGRVYADEMLPIAELRVLQE